MLEVGEIKINQDAHEVFVNGTPVDLSPTEYKLLRFLILLKSKFISLVINKLNRALPTWTRWSFASFPFEDKIQNAQIPFDLRSNRLMFKIH